MLHGGAACHVGDGEVALQWAGISVVKCGH